MKLTNIKMEQMLTQLQPLLPHRDKVGYAAARNTRILKDALTEFLDFKRGLIIKYGETDKDTDGKDTGTISVKIDSPEFAAFSEELEKIGEIEHSVELMLLKYTEIIGILSGEEILELDWMLED